MQRPSFDDYYLGLARAVAARGECTRRRVGAVIVKGHTVVATGYNGTYPGARSCLDGACPRGLADPDTVEPGVGYAASGCVVIHAEVGACLRATWSDMQGATIYCTDEPCESCYPLIRAAGLARIVTPHGIEELGNDKIDKDKVTEMP